MAGETSLGQVCRVDTKSSGRYLSFHNYHHPLGYLSYHLAAYLIASPMSHPTPSIDKPLPLPIAAQTVPHPLNQADSKAQRGSSRGAASRRYGPTASSSTVGPSAALLNSPSQSDKQALSHDTNAWGGFDHNSPEADDYLHNPDGKGDRAVRCRIAHHEEQALILRAIEEASSPPEE